MELRHAGTVGLDLERHVSLGTGHENRCISVHEERDAIELALVGKELLENVEGVERQWVFCSKRRRELRLHRLAIRHQPLREIATKLVSISLEPSIKQLSDLTVLQPRVAGIFQRSTTRARPSCGKGGQTCGECKQSSPVHATTLPVCLIS